MRRWLLASLIGLLLMGSGGLLQADPGQDETIHTIAQNPIPDRDPLDLAVRLRGLDPATFDLARRPDYALGAVERFNIGGMDGATANQREFVLAAAERDVLLWVERGLPYDRAVVQRIVEEAANTLFPEIRAIFGQERPHPTDERIHILNVNQYAPGIAGVFFDTDGYPDEIFPSSNEIKTLLMVRNLQNPAAYLSTLAHEFQHMVQANQDDSEATWVIEGMAEVGSFMAAPDYFSTGFQQAYLAQGTRNQLTTFPYLESTVTYYGGASLFLTYLLQRFGDDIITRIAQEPADDAVGINRALEAAQILDPLTGAPVDFNTAFADFVLANWLNNPRVGDGRYAHRLLGISGTAAPDLVLDQFSVELLGLTVNQYGTRYIELSTDQHARLSVTFEGAPTTRILPTEPYSGRHVYWSQAGNQGNARLTGRFDLREVESATLTFWTWYSLEEFWDYGYLSISSDDGATWQVLTTPDSTTENPFSRAFAPGFTGNSRGDQPQPAPFIGVDFAPGSLIVSTVFPEAPASNAGILVGDELLAINGTFLQPETYISVLDAFRPGEAVRLTLRRAGQNFEVPLELEASPFRTSSRPTDWVQERIDLTPFVGNEVLLRFDYVTDQAVTLPGWVLDDVAIGEINFFDNFEQPNSAWEAEGWVRITNSLPQNYIVQLIEFDEGIAITRLLMPGDGTRGTWEIQTPQQGIPSRGRAVLAISAATPITTEATQFNLRIAPSP
ncbi:MAG: PDZ domain-containing protein [Anaerolineae bacterium]|nr:PDZ domain-containing protein [Anaerolineae bacterium]